MNALEKWRLRLFCQKHGLDIHEIDNSLSYSETMKHLNEFVQRSPEDLAQEYGRILEIMEKETSIGETYGAIPETEGKPLLFFKTVVFLRTRSVNLVKAQLQPFSKNIQWFKRSYLVITAQITETATIIQTLEAKGVRMQFVGSSMNHQTVWQWLPSLGWHKTL